MKATTTLCQLIHCITLISNAMIYLICSIYISMLLDQHLGNFTPPLNNRIMQRTPTKLQQQHFRRNEVASFRKLNESAEIYQVRAVELNVLQN